MQLILSNILATSMIQGGYDVLEVAGCVSWHIAYNAFEQPGRNGPMPIFRWRERDFNG